jgi:hypothetical protein
MFKAGDKVTVRSHGAFNFEKPFEAEVTGTHQHVNHGTLYKLKGEGVMLEEGGNKAESLFWANIPEGCLEALGAKPAPTPVVAPKKTGEGD